MAAEGQFTDPTLGLPTESGVVSAMTPPPPAEGPDLLATLRSGFRAQSKNLDIEVPDANGNQWVARFDAVIPYEVFTSWVLAAGDATTPAGINQLSLAVAGLVYQLKHLELDGQVLRGSDGQALTFDSKALHDALGAIDATDCVRRFFRSDGAVMFAYQELLREAGYTPATPPRR